jgi:hypothetical protein
LVRPDLNHDADATLFARLLDSEYPNAALAAISEALRSGASRISPRFKRSVKGHH